MCKTQCFLAFIALVVNLVSSWDIAITNGDQLEFYTNGTKTTSEVRFKHLTALAYDAVHNMLLFVDKQSDNASIISYNLLTKKYQPLVPRQSDENIQGIAFDPITGKMFWTDKNERSIYWISLWQNYTTNKYGNLFLKMDDEIPRGIAIDSCRGYVYWTNVNLAKPTIERARFDGSERTVIAEKDMYVPISLAIDQHEQKLYWADDREGIHYSIEQSNLDGSERKTILSGTYHQPNAITVSKDSIYWIDWGFKSVWKIDKKIPSVPEKMLPSSNEYFFGIVANYEIKDQIAGVADCKALAKIAQNKTVIENVVTIPNDYGLFCIHGVKTGSDACKCSPGYVGERCQISVCQNYCFHGDCSATDEGKPICKCNAGFIGERCEVDVCRGHCLNDGVCTSVNNQPTCKCTNNYRGKRCELKIVEHIQTVAPVQQCNCTTEKSSVLSTTEAINASIEGYVDSSTCNDGWDPVRDPILMVLGILCGLLCLACTVLITKVLHLRRRPRIKKRIIVNKNVTPLTARPDQCEITIENCCNMNICETPCFEPRNSIKPTLLDGKLGKEEKRNLIANMESQDDI